MGGSPPGASGARGDTGAVIRILIVDDHEAVQLGLAVLFRNELGMKAVGAAGNASDALRLAREHQPDCVLLDYNLGPDDGLEVCRALKAMPAPPAVVVYSAFAGERLLRDAARAGADAVLDKGAPLVEMRDTIRLATRRRSGSDAPPAAGAPQQAAAESPAR